LIELDLIRTHLRQKFEAANVIDLVRKSILMGYYNKYFFYNILLYINKIYLFM
jgi:hypothetical protein